MKIFILAFTTKGYETAGRIKEALESADAGYGPELVPRKERNLSAICAAAFEMSAPLIFVGATGIAVRAIAPFVKDKLTDPPVIVIDELCRYVIPLLSGHVGGANELASCIAGKTGAVPVVTTATDISGTFSADLFAKENGLTIKNRGGIAKVSTSALEGKPVTVCIKDYPPAEHVDVLVSDDAEAGYLRDAASIVLSPKRYAVGIGCRRGKSFEELRAFAEEELKAGGIDINDAGCIATIDLKKDEEGLKRLSQAWRVPLITFDAGLLARAEGDFSRSGTVLEKVGVDNVCERAAVLAAGKGSRIVLKKTARDGMTVAAAEKMKQEKCR